MAAMADTKKPDKYGTPYRIQDPDSPTGYSRVRTNQAGDRDILGPAAAPTKMVDLDAGRKAAKYKMTGLRYEAATKQLEDASTVLGDVDQMLQLVNRVDDSGALADIKLKIRKWAAAFGFGGDVNWEKIADAEAMKAKGMDFILQRISQTKGAISEKEMGAFEAASAGLKNTPAGNRMILALTRKVAERSTFEANAVREAYGKNQGISLKALDDVKIAAREKFGDLVIDYEALKDEATAVEKPPPETGSPVPKAAAKDGITAELWALMPPKEQALWQ